MSGETRPTETCPVCGSCDIRLDGDQYEDGTFYVYMRCDNDCDATWTEVFEYVRTAIHETTEDK
jgi:hypothetical protein